MKNTNTAEITKAQNIVTNAMDDITRATRKVLMDYVSKMYYISIAKAIAFLGIDSDDAKDLLSNMDEQTRKMVFSAAQDFHKTDDKVVSEVEHILTASGMSFENDYQKIKENILTGGKDFVEKALADFRAETPIFKKQLNECIFCFDDIVMLDDRAIQKILKETDFVTLAKALKGTSQEIQEKFFRNMPVRTATMLKEDMEWMGPVYATDVQTNQGKIIQIIFQLEKQGEIVISWSGVSELIE